MDLSVLVWHKLGFDPSIRFFLSKIDACCETIYSVYTKKIHMIDALVLDLGSPFVQFGKITSMGLQHNRAHKQCQRCRRRFLHPTCTMRSSLMTLENSRACRCPLAHTHLLSRVNVQALVQVLLEVGHHGVVPRYPVDTGVVQP